MQKSDLFDDMFQAARYITQLVCEKCKVTEDLKNLIQAFLVMSWVYQEHKKKKRDNRILLRLRQECVRIACYLWHKIIVESFAEHGQQ